MANDNQAPEGENNQSGTTEPQPNQVSMSQEALDALINSKFAQGANKANSTLLAELGIESVESLKGILADKLALDNANKTELEQANSKLAQITSANSTLEATIADMQNTANIERLAKDNNIEQVDYFKYKYEQAKGGDDFEESSFIKNLLTKDSVFAKTVPNTPNTPNTPNANSIKMGDYLKLSEADRTKYTDIQI